MKITVWVVSTCIPGETEPSLPAVFGTEAAAEAYADEMMRGEWDANGPRDEDTDELLPYPGDWWEAQDQIVAYQNEVGSDEDEKWGQWEITSHEIDAPQPLPADQAIRQAREAIDLGDSMGVRGKHPSNIYNVAETLLGALLEINTDAERWRALMSSQRMHFMGSAGFRHEPKDGDPANRQLVNTTPIPRPGEPLHFGMEFWDVAETDGRYPDTFERELLTVYVDTLRERSK